MEKIAREKAILVGVVFPGVTRAKVEEYLEELELLADTAGADVVEKIYQVRDRPDPAFFIGRGKAEEIARVVERDKIELVIFDDELSEVQQRNLENIIGCKVIDRTALILDIFAQHAKTREAKIQVELAQLEYTLSRLTRRWTHLSKQYGGIGTRGPGETQLEVDRRVIKRKISVLKRKLKELDRQRHTQRKRRNSMIRVALVGYTNTGKSTLLNLLANADVNVEDKLFATLDATTRILWLSPVRKVLLTDTVGFIRKLPHHLVASFKSTLDEVREANILLHVVDISSPNFREQIKVVEDTLAELNAGNKPVIMVFNKIDKLGDTSIIKEISSEYKNSVFISALRGINIDSLKKALVKIIDENYIELVKKISLENSKAISFIFKFAEVIETRNGEDNTITIKFRIDKKFVPKLSSLL